MATETGALATTTGAEATAFTLTGAAGVDFTGAFLFSAICGLDSAFFSVYAIPKFFLNTASSVSMIF